MSIGREVHAAQGYECLGLAWGMQLRKVLF